MRSPALTLGLSLLLLGVAVLPASARPRTVLHGRKAAAKAKAEAAPATEPPAAKSKKTKSPGKVTPALALANMIYFEMGQGIHDYVSEVLETNTDVRTKKVTSVRKTLYYLSPATTLTTKDGLAVNYLDADLFKRFLDGVTLSFAGEEVVRGVPCLIVKSAPLEGAFQDNVKYYYVAKDDFRKIRIKAVKTDSDLKKFWFVNDFTYKLIDGRYLLPLKTEGQLMTWDEIPITTTTATFTRYKLNSGLDQSFFDPYLKDKKLDDTFKN